MLLLGIHPGRYEQHIEAGVDSWFNASLALLCWAEPTSGPNCLSFWPDVVVELH